MPCFKGLAVSIHTPDGPLPEYSIQKQTRSSRISAYIPVPSPQFTAGSDRPEQSAFAVSVTLLTPGSNVPYSKPAPTPDDPNPAYKTVGGLPGFAAGRGQYNPSTPPYVPLTSSPNETVAAYIHFDGRPKEEVATLLRKGVETWVNSRWVGVPEAEGGGLAEREFLFREVGLERWLNGLDIKAEDKEKAAKIEKRKQKLEKKRRKKLMSRDSDDEDEDVKPRARPLEALGYRDDKKIKREDGSGDEGMSLSSDDSSEDEMPEPEATGQIKVSLFRVMASGEIKKGEYSPSFDAHDDEDEGMQEHSGDDPGVDHTTSFAKPKTLDPKSISTQTVTGIDDPSQPFATFTFFYRGQRECDMPLSISNADLYSGQLQKMGILPGPTSPDPKQAPTAKRKSRQIDLTGLQPLKADKGTTGFAGYRDERQRNGHKRRDDDDMDSDGEEGGASSSGKAAGKSKKASIDGDTNGDLDDEAPEVLSVEELRKRAELADGVKKMQLKRQHSFDPSQGRHLSSQDDHTNTATSSLDGNTSNGGSPDLSAQSPALPQSQAARLLGSENGTSLSSPFKKQRGSVTSPNVPPLNLGATGIPTPSQPHTSNLDSSVPDIRFTPASSQPSFNSISGGNEPTVTTTGNAEDATVVPPPPAPTSVLGSNTETKVDEDVEL